MLLDKSIFEIVDLIAAPPIKEGSEKREKVSLLAAASALGLTYTNNLEANH
jgi:hypothetical protein